MKRPPISKLQVAVDIVIFTIEDDELKTLLVKRVNEPFKDEWALPGGFVWEGENTLETAQRILKEKTGVKDVFVEQLYTFDSLKRDPRGQIISVAYFALLPIHVIKTQKSKHLPTLTPVKKAPKLAFDHNQISKYATSRLRAKLSYTNVAYSLLPEKFTLTQLQKIYEIILDKPQDKRNFRRKYQTLGLIKPTNTVQSGEKHRPAKLFKFTSREKIELPDKAF